MEALLIAAPFVSAFLYALASMFLKRAANSGIGPAAMCFCFNAFVSAVYAPVLLLTYDSGTAEMLWIVGTCTVLFLLGQICTYLCVYVGDVSIMNPVMGAKVLVVALIAYLVVGIPMPSAWVWAAFICAAAIFTMGFSGLKDAGRTFATVVMALLTCLFYGTVDVVMQLYAPKMGVLFFISALSVSLLPASLPLLPWALKDFKRGAGAGVKWLYAGIPMIVIQDILFCLSLSLSKGGAVAVNILYSTRGLWSIFLVWALGAHFANREALDAGCGAFLRRTAGAFMLLISVVMVLVCE